jgi:exopolysaccharide biosynthesis WecB/TagA/CpsF family protein
MLVTPIPDPSPPQNLIRMAEGRLNIGAQDELIERIVADAKAGLGGTVFTLNLDHLVKLAERPNFRAAYQRASYVTADGAPVVSMARGLGGAVDRVTGADLVLPLCRAAAASGIAVHFFGTSDQIRDDAALRIRAEIPEILIAGSESPALGFDPEGEDARAAVKRIEASGAKICFVALGAPKQELFANLAVCRSTGVLYVCIGAALDFLAGSSKRAPEFVRRTGFEWAWRLVQEPRRLAGRYARSLVYYLSYRLGGADDRHLKVDRRRRDLGPPPAWRMR